MTATTSAPGPAGADRSRTPGAPRSGRPLVRLAAVATILGGAFVTLRFTGALDLLSFSALATHREWLVGEVIALGPAAPIVFVVVYAGATALSLPTGLFLSTVGGFLFGTAVGSLAIVVGATAGATIVFLAARSVLGDALRRRAGPFLTRLEAGFRADALSYMLVLRLVPLFPFWLVNLAPAFLGVRLATFVAGTFVGIIPGALVFASVGTGLGAVLSAGGMPDEAVILQPSVLLPILGLAVLALVPVAFKRIRRWRAGRTEPRS